MDHPVVILYCFAPHFYTNFPLPSKRHRSHCLRSTRKSLQFTMQPNILKLVRLRNVVRESGRGVGLATSLFHVDEGTQVDLFQPAATR